MEARSKTKDKYLKFLGDLANRKKAFKIELIAKKHKVDLKLIGWLKLNSFIHKATKGNWITDFDFVDTGDVLLSFLRYRDNLGIIKHDIVEGDVTKFNFEKEDKLATHFVEDGKPDIDKDMLIDNVIEYTQLAIKMGKKDIKGFVKALLNTK